MIRTLLKGFVAFLVLLLITIGWSVTLNKPKQTSFSHYGLDPSIRTLQQSWTSDIRQQVIHTTFGSHILPLEWFLHLQHPKDKGLLADPQHIEALGFIPQQHTTNNTYALPLGFSVTDHEGEPWVGLTCAACHTGLVSMKGQKILIDGGAGLLNFSGFEHILQDALAQTLNNEERVLTFKLAIGANDSNMLRSQLEARLHYFKTRLAVNHTDTPYGYGRLDAFGIIFNAIAAEALNMPANARAPDAPVSIPVLWDASHLDVVQWNGSAPNKEPGPLGQNIPTSIAVYGSVKMSPHSKGGYSSSVNIKNLGYLQNRYYKLTAPRWPKELFGALDHSKRLKGANIYSNHCLKCHSISESDNAKRQINTTLIDSQLIGTDPVMANNFVTRKVHSGFLMGKKQAFLFGEILTEETRPLDLLVNATVGIMLKKPFNTLTALATEYEDNIATPINFNRQAYKARPLNGIWSSAPYLHNGSVPTLWDLLQAPAQRPAQFFVGNTELDLIKVGYQSHEAPNTSLFDTRLYGNSNAGHIYGTDLTDEEKWQLVEYLKSL